MIATRRRHVVRHDNVSRLSGGDVVGHFKCSSTHEGEWRGIQATGRRFEDIDEIYIFRVERGKLVNALAVIEDNLARMRQLGLDP